jgi:hypothetical protein
LHERGVLVRRKIERVGNVLFAYHVFEIIMSDILNEPQDTGDEHHAPQSAEDGDINEPVVPLHALFCKWQFNGKG